MTSPDHPVLEPSVLEQLNKLDPDGSGGFVVRLMSTYAQALARLDVEARGHAERADLSQLAIVAHTLKSASASVGALSLSRCCEEIEHSIRQRQTDGIAQRLEAFFTEVQRVQSAVQAMLESKNS